MRIGIDCRFYSSKFTGIGRYVYELVKRIPQYDKENKYYLFFNESEYEDAKIPSKNFKKVLVDAPIYSLKEQTNFLITLKKHKLDLMHFTHFNAPFFYKKPSIVTIHDLTLTLFPGKKKNTFLHRMAYQHVIGSAVKNSKYVITISENSKNDIMNFLKTPYKKIKVIYEGVADEFMNAEEKNNKVLKKYHINEKYLLYTGVWRGHKNLPRLIEAFRKIKDLGVDKVKDLKLVITGKEDPLYNEVKDAVKKFHLQKDVIFSGLVPEEDLISLYQNAYIYVLPSLYEGFGLTPLEAMATGVPVAASKTSCIPEICGEDNAVFFNPYSIDDMANSIYKIIESGELRENLIEKGLKRVHDFSWNDMTEKTVNLYKKCLTA